MRKRDCSQLGTPGEVAMRLWEAALLKHKGAESGGEG